MHGESMAGVVCVRGGVWRHAWSWAGTAVVLPERCSCELAVLLAFTCTGPARIKGVGLRVFAAPRF